MLQQRLLLGFGGLGSLVAGFMMLATAAGWWLSGPGYDGPVSDHFDGTVFLNSEFTQLPNGSMAFRMMREPRGAWSPREVATQPPPPQRVSGTELQLTFINHSTTLIQVAGLNILTDPIWSDRCSASQWVGPKRFHAPPFPIEDLPPIDMILVSHNHYDHLDVASLVALAERDNPRVYAGLGNADLLRGLGIDAVDLDWGQAVTHGPVEIIGAETRHFSSRGLFDRNKTLWLGFVVKSEAGNVYFGGDTGYGPHFAATGAEHGPFRLALLPIGAYGPRWFMGPIHQDPVEAVAAHNDLRAQTSVGIHFGTFRLTSEGQDDPIKEMAQARNEAGLPPDAFRALLPGEGLAVP